MAETITLTDVHGVGQKKADKIMEELAGHDLASVTPAQIAAIEGVSKSVAERIVRHVRASSDTQKKTTQKKTANQPKRAVRTKRNKVIHHIDLDGSKLTIENGKSTDTYEFESPALMLPLLEKMQAEAREYVTNLHLT